MDKPAPNTVKKDGRGMPYQTLIERLCSPERRLWRAIKQDNAILLSALLDAGCPMPKFDEYRKTPPAPGPLFYAAAHGSFDCAELLLDRGLSANEKTSMGENPLFAAAYNRHGAVLGLLISRGGDVNADSSNDLLSGATPSAQIQRNCLEPDKEFALHMAHRLDQQTPSAPVRNNRPGRL